MNKQLLFSVILLNLSSNIFCMFGMAQRMRNALPIRAAVPSAIRLAKIPQHNLMPARTLIYSVDYWKEEVHPAIPPKRVDPDGYLRPLLRNSLLGKNSKFASIKVAKDGTLTHRPNIRYTFPGIPEPLRENHLLVARLLYLGLFGRNLEEPQYLIFENNDDIKEIVNCVKNGREVACGGYCNEIWEDEKGTTKIAFHKYWDSTRGEGKEFHESIRGRATDKPAKKIEFYALPAQWIKFDYVHSTLLLTSANHCTNMA